jgi:glycosyltransferase involved in cell wall biosynthesis
MTEGNAGGGDTRERTDWLCFQAGHRERYGIPRALLRKGRLGTFITDLWVRPGSPAWFAAAGRAGRRMRDRYHPDIPPGKIISFSGGALMWDLLASLRGLRGDDRLAERNAWWIRRATTALRQKASGAGYAFIYCYEARDLFREARRAGLTPVLGQIDPGPVEDRKVAEVVGRWPQYRTPFRVGSVEYYAKWREECRLAGHIVVNSEWSRDALAKEGIDPGKLVVCPLVYSQTAESLAWQRTYPEAFSRGRPLRVLFLGQCILRKGIAETIEAARALADRPVEFTFVGNTDIEEFESHFGRARIRYFPRVSRAECEAFYRAADVFLFPTHSDGFGLTQLEARSWRLPIVASRYCADVVSSDGTGWVLEDVSSAGIAKMIEHILDAPSELARRSANIAPWRFGLDELGDRLARLPRGG